MICPKCGVDNADGPAFCRNCGEGLTHKGFADWRLFPAVHPEEMKKHSIRAARMTHKYGMTRDNVAMWGRLEFKKDVMAVGVDRKFVSKGGMGGSVSVVPQDGGSRVGIIWEKDTPRCREVTGHFWQNLDRVAAPGGLKLGPRSAFLQAATLLFVIIAILTLINALSYYTDYQQYQDSSSYNPYQWQEDAENKGDLLGGAVVNAMLCCFTAVAIVAIVKRQSYVHVRGLGIYLTVAYGVGSLILLALGLGSSLVYGILAFGLSLGATVCISKAKEEFET